MIGMAYGGANTEGYIELEGFVSLMASMGLIAEKDKDKENASEIKDEALEAEKKAFQE